MKIKQLTTTGLALLSLSVFLLGDLFISQNADAGNRIKPRPGAQSKACYKGDNSFRLEVNYKNRAGVGSRSRWGKYRVYGRGHVYDSRYGRNRYVSMNPWAGGRRGGRSFAYFPNNFNQDSSSSKNYFQYLGRSKGCANRLMFSTWQAYPRIPRRTVLCAGGKKDTITKARLNIWNDGAMELKCDFKNIADGSTSSGGRTVKAVLKPKPVRPGTGGGTGNVNVAGLCNGKPGSGKPARPATDLRVYWTNKRGLGEKGEKLKLTGVATVQSGDSEKSQNLKTLFFDNSKLNRDRRERKNQRVNVGKYSCLKKITLYGETPVIPKRKAECEAQSGGSIRFANLNIANDGSMSLSCSYVYAPPDWQRYVRQHKFWRWQYRRWFNRYRQWGQWRNLYDRKKYFRNYRKPGRSSKSSSSSSS